MPPEGWQQKSLWKRNRRPGGVQRRQAAIGGKCGPAAEAPSWPRRSTLDARRSTLDARRSTLDARRSTLDARRSTLDARRSTLDARRSTLDARRSTLDARRSTIKVETAIQECQALFDGGGAWPGDHAPDGLCLFHGLLLCDKPALGCGRGRGFIRLDRWMGRSRHPLTPYSIRGRRPGVSWVVPHVQMSSSRQRFPPLPGTC